MTPASCSLLFEATTHCHEMMQCMIELGTQTLSAQEFKHSKENVHFHCMKSGDDLADAPRLYMVCALHMRTDCSTAVGKWTGKQLQHRKAARRNHKPWFIKLLACEDMTHTDTHMHVLEALHVLCPPLYTICGDGKVQVPLTPPLGMLDTARSVGSCFRCPGQGSWFGSKGMLFLGSSTLVPFRASSTGLLLFLLGSFMFWPYTS
eukprot:scaffold24229_cov22-Tisochrysis_lutea.AAC.1